MTRAPSILLPLLCLAVAAGCESAFSISSDGIIHVLVTSSGSGSDSDGFTLTVDGGDPRSVASGESVELEGLAQGTHTVLLSGIAANCAVQGDNPRSVLVGPAGGGSVSFTVACDAAPSDGFQIFVSTSGDAPDPDGYRLAVAGAPIRQIAINAVETFVRLAPGGHLITLKDMADGCVLAGGNPQLVEVLPGRIVQVRLDVLCGSADSS
jgi:hypothetical protein